MKKQGKVKSVPVKAKDLTKGIQVIDKFGNVSKVYSIDSINKNYVEIEILCRDGEIRYHSDYLENLKTLVVEYDYRGAYDGKPHHLTQLPLKRSQWQSAIDNNEVDSDKIVDFEIIDPILKSHLSDQEYAEIIPQKKRVYTFEDMDSNSHRMVSNMF